MHRLGALAVLRSAATPPHGPWPKHAWLGADASAAGACAAPSRWDRESKAAARRGGGRDLRNIGKSVCRRVELVELRIDVYLLRSGLHEGLGRAPGTHIRTT